MHSRSGSVCIHLETWGPALACKHARLVIGMQRVFAQTIYLGGLQRDASGVFTKVAGESSHVSKGAWLTIYAQLSLMRTPMLTQTSMHAGLES